MKFFFSALATCTFFYMFENGSRGKSSVSNLERDIVESSLGVRQETYLMHASGAQTNSLVFLIL